MEGTSVAAGVSFDRVAVFGRDAPLVVEVGTGAGDCVVAAAAADPERDFLALEVWRPGVGQTISQAVRAGVGNLRVLGADAASVFDFVLPTGSVEQVWTFFPDPWPKARHHKRRLVAPDFAADVARVLTPGGRWRLATDWDDYAWAMRDVLRGSPDFVNPNAGRLADPRDVGADPGVPQGDFAPRFQGRVMTRFERKGLDAGRVVHDLDVVRTCAATPADR